MSNEHSFRGQEQDRVKKRQKEKEVYSVPNLIFSTFLLHSYLNTMHIAPGTTMPAILTPFLLKDKRAP